MKEPPAGIQPEDSVLFFNAFTNALSVPSVQSAGAKDSMVSALNELLTSVPSVL
jgi:hypothetical protein